MRSLKKSLKTAGGIGAIGLMIAGISYMIKYKINHQKDANTGPDHIDHDPV